MSTSKPAGITALVGTTASGKTEMAIRAAQEVGAHILSCDSLLVYKELNIGTAKPTEEEMAGVPHHGLDLVAPDQAYTAGDYLKDMRAVLDDLQKKGIPALIVGGTGFYLKALLFGVWDAPPTQPEFRAKLDAEFDGHPSEYKSQTLYRRLAAADPEYAAKIMPQDLYRIVRALEIIEATGEPVTARLEKRVLRNPLPYPCPVFGIRRGSRDLEHRIIARTNQMFSRGLVNEVKDLLRKYPEAPKPLRSVGYSEVLDHFAEKMTLAECRERVVISTRQLAKKQRTFFKTFPGIQWFDLPQQEDELLMGLRRALRG